MDGGLHFNYLFGGWIRIIILWHNNNIQPNARVLVPYSSLSLHLVVAHAGMVGCLVGVTLWSFLKKSLPNFILYQCTHVVRSNITRKLGMIVSLVTVTGISFGCIELEPIFVAVHQNIQSQRKQETRSQSKMASNREQIILHLEYHPKDTPYAERYVNFFGNLLGAFYL